MWGDGTFSRAAFLMSVSAYVVGRRCAGFNENGGLYIIYIVAAAFPEKES